MTISARAFPLNGAMCPIGQRGTSQFDSASATHSGLADAVHRHARERPLGPAVEFDGQIITYAQLHYHALQLSRQLTRDGAALGEAIGILTGTGFEQVIAQAAVVYAGCTCCALDPTLPAAQLQYRLTNAGARFCLMDQENFHRLRDYRSILVQARPVSAEDVSRALDVSPPRVVGREHVTHLMHTSGTTGKPKAVRIQAKGLIHLSGDRRNVPVGVGDRTAQTAMVSFDISLFEIWVTLLCGATIVPIPRSLLLDIPLLIRTWLDLRVTVMLIPASLLPVVVLSEPTVFSKMNVVYSGGEMPNLPAMRVALEQGPPKYLLNCYGPTECCIFSLVHEVTLEDTKQGVCPLTRLIANTQIAILDEQKNPVGEGEVGELFIGGDGVSPGYVNLPDKTAQRFVTSREYPSLPPSCNFYATGDLVRRNRSGEVYIVGRVDNQVKIRGYRVELEGVEVAALETGLVSAVAACKVQGDGDDDVGASLVVFVVPRDRETFTSDRLTTAMSKEVPEYLVPQVAICDELPLNGHSKVDRERLVREFLEAGAKRQLAVEDCHDQTTIARLRKIWHAVLPSHGTSIQDGDTFTSLGGTSLQAAMLLIRIKREFSVQLSAVMVYEQLSLAEMARSIDAGGVQYTIHAAHNRAYRQDVNFYKSLSLQKLPGKAPDWHAAYEGRIFLTGATGFVGAFMLQTLLSRSDVKTVVCLVRAKNDQAARHRLMSIQTKYQLCSPEVDYTKLVVIAGTLESPTLGLGEQQFQALGYWASAIFHSGAHVNYAQHYQAHRDANVLGTANILRFQATGRPKRLFYISTLNIYGPTGLVDGYLQVREDDSIMKYMDAVQYDNGYAQSKWVAEKMITDAMKDEFPITVFRPGAVFCHSQSGTGNPSDFVTRLMASCVRMKCFPNMERQSKNFVPVDYLVDAVIHLSQQECSLGQMYNVVPEMSKQPEDEMGKMFRMLEAVTKTPMEEISYEKWLDRLRLQDDNDPLRPLVPMLEEKVYNNRCRWEMYEQMPIYRTDNLRRDLRGVPGLSELPGLDQPLLERFLASVDLI